jgi:SSS family solute:Na+ symporter
MALSTWDWIIIIGYLLGMIGLSVYLSRGQKDQKDYYLGGNDTGVWPIAISTMATQCSTNSILGAPAFVAFTVGGGLLWLQYEIAVPLAMIVLMIFLLPMYRKLNIISVYAYLEKRFGIGTRVFLSVMFQFLRAFSTGVTVYGISLVIEYCTGVPFLWAVIMLGIITIVYDSIGGMKAVIYSDVIQMVVLYGAIILTIIIAVGLIGGWSEVFSSISPERLNAIDFSHNGIFDGKKYAFWPMLFGGFFLYISYYGCDQTQVQRELSTKCVDDTNMSLFINGTLRFPLVLTYCLLGVCIAAYVAKHPEFINSLPIKGGSPEFNMAVPVFVLKFFPVGAVGLFMVGLFSAAMSSLDSTINSLSATTMQDVLKGYFKIELTEKQELWYSKVLTVFWGTVCCIFAFWVGGISSSIIESINKIGSLSNGPILAVFLMGVLTKRVNSYGALSGLIVGVLFNAFLWLYAPMISWLWWNVIGFFIAFAVGYLVSMAGPTTAFEKISHLVWQRGGVNDFGVKKNWTPYYIALILYATFIVISLIAIGIRG